MEIISYNHPSEMNGVEKVKEKGEEQAALKDRPVDNVPLIIFKLYYSLLGIYINIPENYNLRLRHATVE